MLFWEDGMKDDGVLLIEKYPRLYHISQQQHQYIHQLFMEDIEGLIIQLQRQDTWNWEGDSSRGYTVGNAYMLLDRDSTNENQVGVFTALWKLKIPSKASFFA